MAGHTALAAVRSAVHHADSHARAALPALHALCQSLCRLRSLRQGNAADSGPQTDAHRAAERGVAALCAACCLHTLSHANNKVGWSQLVYTLTLTLLALSLSLSCSYVRSFNALVTYIVGAEAIIFGFIIILLLFCLNIVSKGRLRGNFLCLIISLNLVSKLLLYLIIYILLYIYLSSLSLCICSLPFFGLSYFFVFFFVPSL